MIKKKSWFYFMQQNRGNLKEKLVRFFLNGFLRKPTARGRITENLPWPSNGRRCYHKKP